MPPFHDPHTLYRIQQHLGSAMIGFLLPSLERRVLEEQTNPVVAHVCADINSELEENTIKEVGSDTPARHQTGLPFCSGATAQWHLSRHMIRPANAAPISGWGLNSHGRKHQ